MKDYVRVSLETHLFFARNMKEHALFLEVGFLRKDAVWMQEADRFRKQFENFLRSVLCVSNGLVSDCVLNSEELVTPFTMLAEQKTSSLSGIPIDWHISQLERKLQGGWTAEVSRKIVRQVSGLNREAVRLLDGIIEFQERILNKVGECRLFTTNYPLLLEHIIREAKLYRDTVITLMDGGKQCGRKLQNQEMFWNQIMMEHALFIRGLLDPSEEALIDTADELAMEFRQLLEMAEQQDCHVAEPLMEKSMEEALKLREFKAAGAKGILECEIKSLILPLLADHVLREANHYIRLLECSCEE